MVYYRGNEMKITRIEVIPLVCKLKDSFTGSTYGIINRNTIVTRVYTDGGIMGEAFGGDEDRWQERVVFLIRQYLAPMLVGQELRDVEQIWEMMFHSNVDLGNRALHVIDLINRAILMQAIAAIDIAIWDALGKLMKVPLYKLLGGYKDRVPVIAIGGYYDPTDLNYTALQKEITGYQKMGLYGVKLKVGKADIAEDVRRVRAVRDAVGNDFIIACDANQAWTPEQAIEFCLGVMPSNVRWIEEPVRWYDQLGGLRAVQEAVPLPVVAGQGEITRFGCRDLITHGRVKILNVDATIAGGVTEWRRIAGMASAFNVQMAHHEESQVALHLLASIPHGLYVEIFPSIRRDPLWYELPVERPVIRDGTMHLPDQPGLGMSLNEDVIARYRLN